jgi:hypothetical protein
VARRRQLGTAPATEEKTVKVLVGRAKTVKFTVVAPSDQIDLHQAAGGRCSVRATIIDTFGEPQG